MSEIERLFHEFRATAYRWAFTACRAHEEALDAVQEAFSRLIRERPAFANDRAAAAWLRRVTVGVVIDGWRRRKSLRRVEDDPTRSDRGDARALEIEQFDERENIRHAMADLSDRQRLVLIAKCCDGMTFAEIAEELGVATPTVKTHYVRALEAVRGKLRGRNDDAACDAAPSSEPYLSDEGVTHELR